MSTRALYSFMDEDNKGARTINIYKHHDGYPEGALEALTETLDYVWDLPRFEADEFAAGFCAATKVATRKTALRYGYGDAGGGTRVMPQGLPSTVWRKNCSDIEWRYVISCKNGRLYVTVIRPIEAGLDKMIFQGTFAEFKTWATKNPNGPREDDE